MAEESAKKILTQGEYGVLSMVSASGHGYGIPLSYVYLEDAIYFHCAHEGYKIDCIKNNNKVSFCVVGSATTLPEKFSVKYRSVVVFGQALVVSGQEKEDALMGLVTKYSSDFTTEGKEMIQIEGPDTTVIKIKVEQIVGKGQ